MATNNAPLSTTLGAVGSSGQLLTTMPGGNVNWSGGNYGSIGIANQAATSITASGTIKCKDVEIDDVSMKDVLKQISQQVGLFIPPNIETLNVPAVQQAYTDYRNAREAFQKAKENLDLMVSLCMQPKNEE